MTVAAVLAGGFLFAAEDNAAVKEGKAKGEKPQRAERPRKEAKAAKTLTPEERADRRKEALAKRETRLKALKEKKAAGTLTEKEQQLLDRIEKGGRPGAGGRRPEGGEPKVDQTK